MSEPELLWQPSKEAIERSNLTRYMRWLEAERGHAFDDYESLHPGRSIRSRTSGLRSATTSRSRPTASRGGARRSHDARRPLVRGHRSQLRRARLPQPRRRWIAIRHQAEGGELGEISWGELRERVGAFASGLRSLGVERGDRIVAYLPNSPGAVIGFLASASIGAIWSSCSPDFGPSTVVDRFAQIEPKILLAVDGYSYNGREFDRMKLVRELESQMPTLTNTVLVPCIRLPDRSCLRRNLSEAAPGRCRHGEPGDGGDHGRHPCRQAFPLPH